MHRSTLLRREERLRVSRVNVSTCWIALAGVLSTIFPAWADLPPENRCPQHRATSATIEDGSGAGLREGQRLAFEEVLELRALLPAEVWRHRNTFFHEGMRLEIGPCHRRYATPAFFGEATAAFAGNASLDAHGNLRGHIAGLPFPPESLPTHAGDASAHAAKWAWNFERRYRGAGPWGRFRLVDLPSRAGGVQVYRGEWHQLQTGHRADLAKSHYRVPKAAEYAWVAGGRFFEPMGARHLAWRQLRPLEAATRYTLPDITFVYVPSLRKSRRAASAWVDGLYTPRYRVGTDGRGGGLALAGGGAIHPAASEAIAATENLRRGFEGLTLRPNAYHWRVLDEREVLAPLNVTRSGYPEDPERNFGPSGLSVGNDRWDVRHAIVIQGALRERGRERDLITLYLDLQTQQPLYWISKTRGGDLAEVGILLHRYSGDRMEAPTWPTGAPANVFDPVAAVFVDSADGHSGWRRENYSVSSLPPSDEALERWLSTSTLERGH